MPFQKIALERLKIGVKHKFATLRVEQKKANLPNI
jgi:hypothetical protein